VDGRRIVEAAEVSGGKGAHGRTAAGPDNVELEMDCATVADGPVAGFVKKSV
jgi:hypothetical protein